MSVMKGLMSETNTMTDIKTENLSDNADVKSEIKPNMENMKNILENGAEIKEECFDSKKEIKTEIKDINSILKEVRNSIVTDINESKEDTIKTEIDHSIVKTEIELNTANVKTETIDDIEQLELDRIIINSLKRKRSRTKRSRKRKYPRQTPSTKEVAENCSPQGTLTIDLRDDVEYCLTVTNLPNSWSFMDIKNYIDMQCGPVDEIEMLKDDKTGNGAIRLSYQNENECEQAMKKLKDKEIEGTKLVVTMKVANLESDGEVQTDSPNIPEVPQAPEPPDTTPTKTWTPDLDAWEIDPKGLYGLKESFLKSLGITPPLDKWVHVSNFRCDKSELRDVLELAGKVLMCSVFQAVPKYANVMYSHPLEAVQAVSLLNGQSLYGQPLKVVMDRSPLNAVLLPRGLSNIGKGLGANGKPLHSILQHYRRLLNNQSASLNREAFEDPNNSDPSANSEAEEIFTVKNVEDFNYVLPNDSVTNSGSKPTVSTSPVPQAKAEPAVNPSSVKTVTKPSVVVQRPTVPAPTSSPIRQNLPMQNFQPRNFGPNCGSYGPRPFGPGPRPMWNGPGPIPGPMGGPRPMPGPAGPMLGPVGPMPGPIGPMQRPGGPMQRPGGPMQRPGGPIQGPGGPMNRPGGPMHRPVGPMHRPSGPMQGPGGPMQRPGGPMPMAGSGGPMQRPPGPMQGPLGSQMYGNEPVQLQLSNLPPTTTFPILCEKMAECGQVVSIQLTTPGCAVVTFANRMQADRCIMTYNNNCIDGHMLQVKYS